MRVDGSELGSKSILIFISLLRELGWWTLTERKGSVRRKGQGEEKGEREEKQKEGGQEDERREESETEIEKEDDAPSPRFEVENFLIENYESYLLCRGFGRRVV